jgi:SAM-dependent methyltransferase
MTTQTPPPPTRPGRTARRGLSKIRDQYDGTAGALTAFTGVVTGHGALAGRLIGPQAFDVRGCKRLLDAACGNGRYSKHLLRHADKGASLTAFDLSQGMLRRARRYLKSDRVGYVVADVTRLPFPDRAFDAAVCGWVLEHFTDPRPALREMARVLAPGGKMLLLTTEDTLLGDVCAFLWNCRTYGRRELRCACEESGLSWYREHWFSGLHRRLGMGGVVVELRRQEVADGRGP